MSRQDSQSQKSKNFPPQQQTALKWGSDGELSSVDMARILDKLANPELIQCDLVSDLGGSPSEDSKISSPPPLPISAWIP